MAVIGRLCVPLSDRLLLMMGVLFCCGAGFFIRRRMYPSPLSEEPAFNVSFTRQPVSTPGEDPSFRPKQPQNASVIDWLHLKKTRSAFFKCCSQLLCVPCAVFLLLFMWSLICRAFQISLCEVRMLPMWTAHYVLERSLSHVVFRNYDRTLLNMIMMLLLQNMSLISQFGLFLSQTRFGNAPLEFSLSIRFVTGSYY